MWVVYIVYIAITILVFIYGYYNGKNISINERKPCVETNIRSIENKLRIARKINENNNINNDITKTICNDNNRIYDHCTQSPYVDNTFLHLQSGNLADEVFPNLHHPGHPAKWSIVMSQVGVCVSMYF